MVTTMPLVPEVGIVIANHNNAAYVKNAIESVARQTVRKIRAVVVDDASSDESDEAICGCLSDLADPRFRYVRLPSNLGQAGAIRCGIALLSTPFVCFLDSDDLWYEGFLARHLEAHLNADFPVALTYCDSHIVDSEGRMLAGTAWWFDFVSGSPSTRILDPSVIPGIGSETGELVYRGNPRLTFRDEWSPEVATNSMSSMMFRRDFVDLVLTLPNDDLRLFADFYLSTFAYLLTGVIAVHEALYAYRMHGQNKHSNGSVLGGTYNSSKTSWGPKRDGILRLISAVLQSQAQPIRMAFGDYRYGHAETLMRHALDSRRFNWTKASQIGVKAAFSAKLAQWLSSR
jgi:glycosyltransferase involved in cell wall biosynthesis